MSSRGVVEIRVSASSKSSSSFSSSKCLWFFFRPRKRETQILKFLPFFRLPVRPRIAFRNLCRFLRFITSGGGGGLDNRIFSRERLKKKKRKEKKNILTNCGKREILVACKYFAHKNPAKCVLYSRWSWIAFAARYLLMDSQRQKRKANRISLTRWLWLAFGCFLINS